MMMVERRRIIVGMTGIGQLLLSPTGIFIGSVSYSHAPAPVLFEFDEVRALIIRLIVFRSLMNLPQLSWRYVSIIIVVKLSGGKISSIPIKVLLSLDVWDWDWRVERR